MGTETIANAAQAAKDLIKRRYMTPTRVWGYTSGFKELDYLTGGIQYESPSEYTIVAARSNVGKSAFGMTIALTLAYQFKQKFKDREVRICLLEMDAKTCVMRLIAQLANIPIQDLRSGYITPEQKLAADRAADTLASLPIWFLEGSYSADYVQKFVSCTNKETGLKCGWWLLDHIGIVPTQSAMQANQAFSLGQMSMAFQSICRRIAPGMVLAQLNREATKTKDGKPSVSHIYGSDRILQDCDLAILLDRPETRIQMSEEEKEERPVIEIATLIIGKARNGECRDLEVQFNRRQALWMDAPPEAPSNVVKMRA